jgi:hypothetical protein
MSKTSNPHPDSAMAFYCALAEAIADVDEIWPNGLLVSDELLAQSTDAERRLLRYAQQMHDGQRCIRERLAEAEALQAGFSEDELASPLAKHFVARLGNLSVALDSLVQGNAKAQRQRRRARGGGFRRSTVVSVIVGTLFGLGGGKRVATARLLSQGIPTKDKGWFFDDSEIRNAFDTFARAMRPKSVDRALKVLPTAAGCLVHSAKIYRALLDEARADPRNVGLKNQQIADRLISSGELLERYLSLYETLPQNDVTLDVEIALIDWRLKRLQAEAARQAA